MQSKNLVLIATISVSLINNPEKLLKVKLLDLDGNTMNATTSNTDLIPMLNFIPRTTLLLNMKVKTDIFSSIGGWRQQK